jgi:hypothetical protein
VTHRGARLVDMRPTTGSSSLAIRRGIALARTASAWSIAAMATTVAD